MKKIEREKIERAALSKKQETWIVSGLLGISSVAITQMISVSSMDMPLLLSTMAFSVSIPLLSSELIIIHLIDPLFEWIPKKDHGIPFTATILMTWVGFSGIIFHLSWLSCLLFVISSIIGGIYVRRYSRASLRRVTLRDSNVSGSHNDPCSVTQAD
jgi:hypothetical protein